MKKKIGFWRSLEEYSWKVVNRSPLPRYWIWMGIGLIGIVMMTSWLGRGNSTVGTRDTREVIEKAAEQGDYQLASKLLTQQQTNELLGGGVLGAEAELEDRVYPERVVERRIAELEQKLEEYPGDREIYLGLAELYGELGNQDMSSEYREKARVLDPNDEMFQ